MGGINIYFMKRQNTVEHIPGADPGRAGGAPGVRPP